ALCVGCAPIEDAAALDEIEPARWRQMALDCLRADLTHWVKVLHRPEGPDRGAVRQRLEDWQRNPELAQVRDAAISLLPAAEQQAWRSLWDNVARTLAVN